MFTNKTLKLKPIKTSQKHPVRFFFLVYSFTPSAMIYVDLNEEYFCEPLLASCRLKLGVLYHNHDKLRIMMCFHCDL